jgi:hypothetical protein
MQTLILLKSLPWLSIVGLAVSVSTAFHIFALGMTAKYPGGFWSKAAEVSGVIGTDAQQILQWFQGAPMVAQRAAKVALILATLACVSCTPSQLQQAATIADDVTKIAQVLCLADHARAANARAFSVKDACATVEQLAPYIEQAKNAAPRAACAH